MSNTFPSVTWFLIQAFEVRLGAGGNISSFRYWTRTQLHFDEVEKVSTKTPSIIKTVLRKYGWVMGKNFIVVNVTFFLKFVCVLLWPVEWLFGRTFSSSPTHLTTNDTRDMDQHGGLQAFQVWIIYKNVKINVLPSFSLIWHLYFYFCCYRQLSPPTSSPGRFSLALELEKSALGTRLLWPRLTAVNVGVPKCVTKQRSRDTARSWVWVIVFQICRSLNCEERLPLLVSDSVFWVVSSAEVVLFPLNSSTRKNLRLLCAGVTFVISSSRYERTKTLGKFVILTNEVNQSPWQNCRKKLLGVTFDEHLKFTSHLN